MKFMQDQKITTDLVKQAVIVECECGGKLFSEKLVFKKLSAILSPSGNEEMIPLPIILCEKCGKMPREFDPNNIVPDELKTKK